MKRSKSGRIWKSVVLYVVLTGLCSAHVLYALPATTTTTLQLSSGTAVGNGVAVTLTATVTANGAPVSPGFVTFCDASAKYCEDLAVLGTAAVNSSGVASMKKVLGPGAHMISASFNPTVTNATSTSSIQTVDVPVQVKALPIPIITKSGTSNPLPVQASVSVLGTVPFTGTLSIVQDQGREELATLPVGASTAQFGFAPLVATPAAYTFGGAALVGDFNGDGLPDLATPANYGFGDGVFGYVAISLNDPAHPGQFLPGAAVNDGQVSSLLIGDFNNDGVLDVITPNASFYGDTAPPSYDLFLGDPAHPGQFVGGNDAIYIPANGGFQLAADLNQDGVLDLIGTVGSGNIDVLFGDPAHPGHFVNETTYPGEAGTVRVADLNGDGLLDVVAGNLNSSAYGIAVFLGDPANPGHFLAPVNYPLATNTYPSQIVIGDFNQDGHPDVATLGTSANYPDGDLNVLLNNPSSPGQFLAAVDYTVNSSNGMVLGDFNGDGFLDIAQIDSSFQGLSVLLGDPKGNGEFLAAQSYPDLAPPTSDSPNFISSLTVGDFNTDGLSDLILALQSEDELGYSPVNPLLAQETQTASVSFPSVAWDPSKSPLAQALYSGDDNYDIIGSCDIDLVANPGPPVLYDIHADVSNTAATVLWYWMGDDGAIDYGTTTALGSTTGWQRAAPNLLGGPSYIRLTGLAPSTKYYYRIRAIGYFSGCSHWTNTSPIQSFTTAP